MKRLIKLLKKWHEKRNHKKAMVEFLRVEYKKDYAILKHMGALGIDDKQKLEMGIF